MSLQRYLSVRRSFFIMIIGFVIFVLYLYFFVGVQEILAAFQNINYPQFLLFYSFSIVASLLSIFLYSASWQRLLKALSIRINMKKTFQYHSVGYFIDLVIPCQTLCGEVTRVYLVYSEAKGNYGRIFASASVNRVLNNSLGIFALSVGAFFILEVPNLLPTFLFLPLVLVIIGIAAYNVIIIVAATRRQSAEKLFSRALKLLEKITFKKFRMEDSFKKVQDSLVNFENGFKLFGKHPHYLLVPVLLLGLGWISSLVSFALVFYALNYPFLPVSFFFIAFSLMVLIQGATATFSMGPLDILMTNFFVFYGVTIGASGVAMLLIRLVVFWIPIFVGYVMIEWLGARSLLSTSKQEKLSVEARM